MSAHETPNVSIKWPQFVAGLAGAGGAFASGAALGWPAPAGPRLVDGDERYFPITQAEFGWATSIITLGLAFSCLPIGFLMNAFGRRGMMLVLVVPFLIGWALVIWAQNLAMLLVGRFLLGLAGGCFCISAPQYSTEIAEKEIRGILGTFFGVMIIAGILFVYTIGAFIPIFWTSVVCGFLPLIYGAVLIFVPESPVYFMMKDRTDDAIKSLNWLRGKDYDPTAEIEGLQTELRLNSEAPKISKKEAFSQPAAIWSIAVISGMFIVQQFCGVSVILFFTTNIFIVRSFHFKSNFDNQQSISFIQAAGTDLNPDYQTIIVGTVNLIATIAASLLVDKVGRRILLTLSAAIMAVALSALGAFFFLQDAEPDVANTLGWLPLTSLSVFIISHAIGFGPIPWLMMSELYSKDINSIASPATGFIVPSLTFLVSSTFTMLSGAIGIGQTFWIYAGFSFLGIFYVLFMVPETKGKSLTEIQVMLANKQK